LGALGFDGGVVLAVTIDDVPPEKATEKQVKFLQKLAGERVKEVLEHYKVDKLSDLTIDQASEAISKLKGAK